ncbi:hypothetical protein HanPSC8_Chr14g0614271 [Helianthus annuus]|nr:hypothetical protein HanPSC8_Chr14g0614271 [Helianthus annuus]
MLAMYRLVSITFKFAGIRRNNNGFRDPEAATLKVNNSATQIVDSGQQLLPVSDRTSVGHRINNGHRAILRTTRVCSIPNWLLLPLRTICFL